jgi:glycosyltransferase involved in cell wall biosynthesis
MRIVVVSPIAGSLIRFRGELLHEMVAAGHDVLGVAPENDDAVRTKLRDLGVRYTTVPMSRAGLNPVRDAMTVVALARIFRAWQADLVLVYAPKPVVYGLMAARLVGVPLRSAMVTGVGSALGGGDGLARAALARLLRGLYRVALHGAHVVFFQNEDDEALFDRFGLTTRRNRIVRINGSGVDLEHYAPAPLPSWPVSFVMVGRLIADKGVREYVAAAQQVKRTHPSASFRLVGPLDVNPTAVSRDELQGWIDEGSVDYLGKLDDVRPALADAHVCVLPSYREGMPRSVLEAMSMARPILATDAPGCRDTVIEGQNGYLVPVRDTAKLAERMVAMIDGFDRLAEMGRISRALAEKRFDVHGVNQVILEALELGPPQPTDR